MCVCVCVDNSPTKDLGARSFTTKETPHSEGASDGLAVIVNEGKKPPIGTYPLYSPIPALWCVCIDVIQMIHEYLCTVVYV